MQTQDSIHKAQIATLEATRACPKFLIEAYETYAPEPVVTARKHEREGCCVAGRVYILDPNDEHGLRKNQHMVSASCLDGCLGYTPGDDFWAWLEAAISDLGEDLRINITNELAFYTGIASTVLAQAREG